KGKDGSSSELILYETVPGGAGVLEQFTENQTALINIVQSAYGLLHGYESDGCEIACYDCLLSYYNQFNHGKLDRHVILPFLKSVIESRDQIQMHIDKVEDQTMLFQELLVQCEHESEKAFLTALFEACIRLPDSAQKTLFDEDVPIARPDFFYEIKGSKGLCVFVDGSVHGLPSVQLKDSNSRLRLKLMGYSQLVVSYTRGCDFSDSIQKLKNYLKG
ncbi:MAG: DUF1998 domain-containing protein, partial [Candidatus Cloacimonetes bacterium]|nr:DUF1998 domain-containing protein [Candidatus Cloacimonadota bacterium]